MLALKNQLVMNLIVNRHGIFVLIDKLFYFLIF